ncbi:MAG: Fe-S cluster assembly protein HesB [Mycobacterium sp.]|nr:Fe-S cluster assembly protein HesB [Mycobacterium sp.]
MGRAGTGKPGTGRPGTSRLCLTQDPEADQLLEDDPFALLIGMLLDQQIPMETAFAGPRKLADRLGGLEPAEIAGYDPAKFAEICAKSPAVHRFPGSMAKRLQKLARTVVDDYGGDAAAIWTMGEPDGTEVLRRLTSLPGFGLQKARIFLALLGKQYGANPEGWREAAGDYGDPDARMSIADVVDKGTLEQVRAYKKKMKTAARSAGKSAAKSAKEST